MAIDSSLENAGEINLEEARTQRKKKVYKPSRMIGTVVQKKKRVENYPLLQFAGGSERDCWEGRKKKKEGSFDKPELLQRLDCFVHPPCLYIKRFRFIKARADGFQLRP